MSTPSVRLHRVLLALAPLTLAAATGHADDVVGTRSDKLKEVAHVVELRVDRGHATLSVRRTVDNGGPRHDQAIFNLFLPAGAVATGLRTLGSRDGKPVWFEAELMEAEAAARKYEELTGIGGFYPKDPALLSWRSQGHLALQVFPVPPAEKKTIEYDLVMPTEYREGRDRLTLSGLGTNDLPAEVVVRPVHAGDQLYSDGVPLVSGAHLVLGPERTIELSQARAAAPKLGGGLAVVPVSGAKTMVRPHVEAAARLSEAPAKADVVVLIDASRSRSDGAVNASVAAAHAYLTHMPDASVEVLTFDRHVRGRHGKLVPVKTALADLEALTVPRRNGSHLDVALAHAAGLFEGRAPNARRVVIFTDLLTRAAITPGLVKAKLGATGALVHVAIVDEGSATLAREDESPWARDLRATGGLVWRGSAPLRGDRVEARAAFEELARPVRIDHMRFTVDKLELKSAMELGVEAFPDALPEGAGFEVLKLLPRGIGTIRVDGELWTAAVTATLAPSEDEAKRWSALVFGSSELGLLSDEEMAPLARRGHAVTPVTSLLAIEPGVRPSTEGLDHAGGLGLSGVGRGGGGFGMGRGRIANRFDKRGFLVRELTSAWRACGGKGRASVALETTLEEIVEIGEVTAHETTPGACLRAAAWAVALPAEFRQEHEEFHIDVDG